ncbi:MAG: tetratricopeptide repeat protein [Methanomassiliicoccales archaeon]
MKTLDELLDERMRERVIGALRALDGKRFKELVVQLLENLDLEVTAAAVSQGVVHAEAEGSEGKYLVFASRDPEDASDESLKRFKEKADYVNREPVVILLSELDEEMEGYADSLGISHADRSKLLLLLRKFGMEGQLLRERDRHILAEEGNRYLPSVGRFDGLLQEAEADRKEGRYREALDKLDEALFLKPDQDLVWRRKARVLLSLGDPQEALEACRRALGIKGDARTWYLKALIHHRLGDYEEEVEAYDGALKAEPGMTQSLLNKGATLFQLERYQEALRAFDRLLQMRPNDAQALNNRALVLRAMGERERAMKNVERALELRPDYPEALINRASLLAEMGRLEEAVQAYKEVLARDRDRPALWMELGEVQERMGRFEDAAKSFSVASSLDPVDEEAAVRRDQAMEAAGLVDLAEAEGTEETLCGRYWQTSLLMEALGRLEGALNEIGKCLELDPRNSPALHRRAQLLLESGNLEESVASLREGMRWSSDPWATLDLEALMYRMGRYEECSTVLDRVDSREARRREALLGLGKEIHLKSGDLEEAILALHLMIGGRYRDSLEIWDQLLTRFPDTPEMLNNRGSCLRFLGEMDASIEAFHRATEVHPGYADAWNNMGCVYHLKGECAEAERCFREALLIDHDPRYLTNLCICQLGEGKVEEARRSFTSVLKMEQNPEAINGMGMVAERGKEYVKAIEFYEAALEREPGFQDALKNRDRVSRMLKE